MTFPTIGQTITMDKGRHAGEQGTITAIDESEWSCFQVAPSAEPRDLVYLAPDEISAVDNVSNYAPQIVTLARVIMARLDEEQGMTIEWTGGDLKPRNAYVVGGVVPSLTVSVQDDYALIVGKLVNWLATHHGLMHYAPIGVWRENGHLYFDLVTVLPIDSGFNNVKAIAKARAELVFGEFDAYGNYAETHTI